MPPKQAKKTLWVDCERCGCSITSNDKNIHTELNCTKDQVKCPYIENARLYTWLERAGAAPEGVPRDTVMIHPSAGSFIGAVIGGPLELTREHAPPIIKRMWPSKTSSPSAVILPAADLPGAWSNDNKKVTVTVINQEKVYASQYNN